MSNTIGELSTVEFEALVERAIARRLAVWLTQLTDALTVPIESDPVSFRPEFEASMIYLIDDATKRLTILKVGHRRNIYR